MPDAMDPMTLAMLSGSPDALQTMHQYALAQQLQQMSLGGAQAPQQLGLEGKYPHAARTGPISAVAPLIEAMLARKGFSTAGPAMTALVKKAYGITPATDTAPATPAPSGGVPSAGVPSEAPQGPNPYAPVSQQDIAGTSVPGLSPIARVQGGMSLEGAQKYREMQLAAQKQQHAGTIAQLDSLIKSDHPSQYAQSDQNFMTMWPSLARQMHLDPQADFNDQNVRRALGMVRNPLAASVGIPEETIPEQMRQEAGPFGQSFDVNPITNEHKQVSPREMPAKVGERWNPATSQMEAVYKNWFPTSTSAPSPSTGPGASAPSAGSGVSVTPVGYTAPSPENIKQVGFASTMHSGLQTVRSLENSGYSLSPAQRALLIQVATREDVGDIKQLAYQIGLKNLGGQAQSYLAGMMPIIQAVSHDQSGARLNSTQIRTNLESVIPVDLSNQTAMRTINETRDSFQNSMNLGSGSAAFTPEFNQSVGAMRRQEAQGKVVTHANVQDYASKHGMTYERALTHVQSNGYTVQ